MKKILMTGGGTAGHVTPNIALFGKLKQMGYEIFYIGTKAGMEKDLIEREHIPYLKISAGKLRRYLDIKNITDLFKITAGFFESLSVIKKIKPDIVFSKGGFVSCPVVWAAKICGIPVIIHESDMTPGLANKLSMPFASKICYTFPETKKYIKSDKSIFTGIPVRNELKKGSAAKGRSICSFSQNKPVIVVIGGSLGSEKINKAVRSSISDILKEFNLCHICGKNNIDRTLNNLAGYKQFEYVKEELPHIFAMADLVISRAGATTIFEILNLKKPNILIPLSKQASRGDQILNAGSFKRQGYSYVLNEENLNHKTLIEAIHTVYKNKSAYIKAMENTPIKDSVDIIADLIQNLSKDK